ncbi:hypothetical protein KU617_23165, partial [Salmonella enterica subsp. enterica serovar Montevideo]|nr:hypothetical protein [Salmonella enterica subsp. enterica serovar Montevideo]
MSSIVFRIFNGEAPIIEVGKLSDAPVNTLWLYLILGIIFGCVVTTRVIKMNSSSPTLKLPAAAIGIRLNPPPAASGSINPRIP